MKYKPLNEFVLLFFMMVLMALCAWIIRYNEIEKKELRSVIAEKNDSIRYHRNEQGKLISEKIASEVRAKDLEKMYPEVVKELEKSFDIKIKNLKAYIKNEFSATGTGTGLVTINNHYDSVAKRSIWFRDFNMDDGYLTFHTRLYDSLSSSLYKYTYSDTAQTVIASNKKWWQVFKNEQLYASTMFSNPNAKVTGTTNILVKNYRDKRWAVVVAAGYDPFRMKPTGMVGLGYTIFKF